MTMHEDVSCNREFEVQWNLLGRKMLMNKKKEKSEKKEKEEDESNNNKTKAIDLWKFVRINSPNRKELLTQEISM